MPRRARTSPTRRSARAAVSRRSARRRSTSARATRRCSTRELAAAKGGPILHIPLVLGAVAIAYNVEGVGSGLNFDGETDRQDLRRPDHEVERPGDQGAEPRRRTSPTSRSPSSHRSDGSGTTAVFTDFLTKTSPAWVSKLGGADKSFGKTVAWPTGIGGKGNEGVSALVSQTEGAIGYVELQYAICQQAGLRQHQEQARHVHQALRRDDQRRRGQDVLPARHAHEPDLAERLAHRLPDHGHRRSRLVYQNQTDAGKAKALVNFLSWALTTGQNFPAHDQLRPDGHDPAAARTGAGQQDHARRQAARQDTRSPTSSERRLSRGGRSARRRRCTSSACASAIPPFAALVAGAAAADPSRCSWPRRSSSSAKPGRRSVTTAR